MGKAARDPITGLTPNMERFAQEVANGEQRMVAYRKAYPNAKGKDITIYSNAYDLVKNNPQIMERVRELQAKAEAGAILQRKERQALLTEFALDETVSNSDRLSAVDKLNKMSGDYSETIRQEITAQVDVKEERHMVIEKLLKECGIK